MGLSCLNCACVSVSLANFCWILTSFSPLLRYQAGDHLGVMPANQEDLVMAYAAELGLLDTLDVVYNVNKVDPEEERSLFPLRRVSMRNVLTWCVGGCF